MELSADQVAQYERTGYLVLPEALDVDELAGLREVCAARLDAHVALMDAVGAETLGLSHRESRYFLHAPYRDSPFLVDLLFGDKLAGLAAGLLGPEVFLFLELFVVKWAEKGIPMAWHQDSGYVLGHPHDPYLSVWIALDDMTADNGTLAVLPRDRAGAGAAAIVEHVSDPGATNDLVGYDGDDPGDLVEVPAGSIVAMASTTLHRSGANTSPVPRRAFLVSYSPSPVRGPNGNLWNTADPVVVAGARVPAPA
jgi:ectoine hydroxylase-related dioxygenase (phytanoyl-CoA dioxygenase family)